MSGSKVLLVSLPTSISPSNNKEEAFAALKSSITSDHGQVFQFSLPTFKIGTLDALVQQADELAKLSSACEGVVAKVAESLRSILEGDEDKIAEQKTVNDRPVDHYLQSFTWNKIKYRADKPIAELSNTLKKEMASIDSDVKAKYSQYNSTKTSLASANRSRTGNLSQKSLTSVVNPKQLLAPNTSEYLDQHLLAIPNAGIKEFLATYETLTEMVVPRSSQQLAQDDEFSLFAVTVFKKHSADFVHKCRERRWIVREMKLEQGGRETEQAEAARLEKEERKVWGEALRLGRTGYSDAMMALVHILALRVFVETVLRYGLPLDFVSGLILTTPKLAPKARARLDANFGHLGGNALTRDAKGNVTKDDANMASEMQTAGQGSGDDYSAFVYYEFEIL